MASLHHLRIQHFRGIESFEHTFKTGITCIIGRGDSGKTTIIDAIALVFSQSWSVHLNDSDFYMCNTALPIVIEGTVVDVPDELIIQYDNHLRGVSKDGSIIDDMESEESRDENTKLALTIQMKVTKDLEPTWSIVSYHGMEPSPIKANVRSKLNVFAISDYTDRHFSLNKGNPLYGLCKQLYKTSVIEEDNKVIDVIREAKDAFDCSIGNKFDLIISKITKMANTLGLSLNEMKAMLDHKDIAISENKVSIHENGIPFRLKGKGTKRILSLAILLTLAQPSVVILIDEIEQGLEPDRVQHLVNVLAKQKDKQFIITTHSSNVAVELSSDSIYIKIKEKDCLLNVGQKLQDCIRSNPDAFFARKVLICEGDTEIGVFRAINSYRINRGSHSASCLGVRYVNGTGNALKNYVEGFVSLKYPTALFCDSDPEGKTINDLKPKFREMCVNVVDCEDGLSIEGQVFKDVPWNVIKELIVIYMQRRVQEGKSPNLEQANKDVFLSINARLTTKSVWSENWYYNESEELREALSKASSENKWYKRIDYGEQLGNCILEHYTELPNNCRLKRELSSIISWIDA